MDFQKLLNEWSMQTPQVVTLGTTSLYYLGLFAEFLAAEQKRAADGEEACPCGGKHVPEPMCKNCGLRYAPRR